MGFEKSEKSQRNGGIFCPILSGLTRWHSSVHDNFCQLPFLTLPPVSIHTPVSGGLVTPITHGCVMGSCGPPPQRGSTHQNYLELLEIVYSFPFSLLIPPSVSVSSPVFICFSWFQSKDSLFCLCIYCSSFSTESSVSWVSGLVTTSQSPLVRFFPNQKIGQTLSKHTAS